MWIVMHTREGRYTDVRRYRYAWRAWLAAFQPSRLLWSTVLLRVDEEA